MDDLENRANAYLDEISETRNQRKREPGADDEAPPAREAGPAKSREPRFVMVDEFCALPPEETWLIDGYLEPDSLSVVYGDSESFKSFLCIDMACHIAAGRPWCGREVRKGLALYIAGEGANGLKKRIRAWFEYYGLPMRNLAISKIPVALCDPANVADLVADVLSLVADLGTQPALIVLDTLNTHFGPGDENSTGDMTKVLSGMRALRIATGAHVMTPHHCGHGDKSRSRGSIVLRNGIDWEYRVERQPESLFTTLTNTKSRDADRPPPLSWELTPQPLPWVNNKGEPLSSCVLCPTSEPVLTATKTVLTRPARIALVALRESCAASPDGWTFVADWRKAALAAGITHAESKQGKAQAFLRALESLEIAELVCGEGEKWKPAP